MTIRFGWPVGFDVRSLTLGARSARRLTTAALTWLAAACGAPSNADESLSVEQTELSAGECTWVTADQVFQNQIDPAFVTPDSYDTCSKGYVVDILELSPEYTGDGEASSASLSISHTDTITSQGTCERSTLKTVIYREEMNTSTSDGGSGYNYWYPVLEDSRSGQWRHNRCVLGLNFANGWVAGESYRVAVQATDSRRRTHSVTIRTLPPTDF